MAKAKTKKKMVKKAKAKIVGPVPLIEFSLAKVALADIEPNPVQPAYRTKEGALATLVDQILKTKFIAPPVCARLPNGKWLHLDGWRRITVAKRFGLKHLTIIDIGSSESDTVTWLIALNAATKSVGGTGWLQIWKLSGARRKDALKQFPYMTAKRIQGMIEDMGGEVAFARIVDLIKSPNLYDHVHKTIDFLHEFNLKASTRAVTEWMARHPGMIYTVRAARLTVGVQRRNHANKLAEAIKTNRAYDAKSRSLFDDFDVDVAAGAGVGSGGDHVAYAMAGR